MRSDDGLTWDDIPSTPYYSSKTRTQLREFFSRQSRRRWNRLQRDYKWLRGEMHKAGLNPEDARFLL